MSLISSVLVHFPVAEVHIAKVLIYLLPNFIIIIAINYILTHNSSQFY